MMLDPDSPNVFANEMFSINAHDTIRTLQYKNILVSKRLIRRLLKAYGDGNIVIRRESKDFGGWYNKRTAADGKIDFHGRTRDIYNLVRGVSRPFPGLFVSAGKSGLRCGVHILLMRCWIFPGSAGGSC